jgi:hypothetical protein
LTLLATAAAPSKIRDFAEFANVLQRQIAEASAKESFEEAVGAIRNQTGVTVPKRQV